ncbi:SDR family oxidoreductase [Verrucosispora sp. WMMC514]|uniref:SDR family NAD(P)-dependent oxidoreductase n=1 Tax=Verrucosispora sp. WMMC514 TaxID=3015156 RepID=UPI00248CA1B8|nr:SDR family oxidoreductase [Verrucosispora sp. WMMC514]WBB89867.1 SDR family NAD(P)-dependent oxidoreductase [Verrucosispora sp. WMMC514]
MALVTGATGGIGRAICQRLAHTGHDLTICARNAERLAEVADALRCHDVQVRVESADMAVEADVLRVAHAHVAAYHRLDALVLAAGVGTAGPIETVGLRRFDKQIAVNVRAPYTLVHELMPLMRATAAQDARNGAKIIAISSITGVYAEPGLAAYGASKAALGALCRSINVEASDAGVTATAVSPGYVDTDMSAWVHNRIPPEKMITAGDVAELVMSLTRLSAQTVVPELVITRAGDQLHRA